MPHDIDINIFPNHSRVPSPSVPLDADGARWVFVANGLAINVIYSDIHSDECHHQQLFAIATRRVAGAYKSIPYYVRIVSV